MMKMGRIAMLVGLLLGSLKSDDGNDFLIVTDVIVAGYLGLALLRLSP